ncbi:TetR/AcrR family transcriptional regulator [Nonomuraea sp. NPDC049784]|uniref:TetR/AcrR family transcriptional regulator n=1 Tax=Nonomuraea sp. NPDC049784 TaxID=3154361 RepID=UPI0033E01BE0
MARPRKFDADAAIDAAMDTFWTKGYTATSTDDLAEVTGMLRGSLYNAFGSKRRLFELALRRYRDKGAAGQNAIQAGLTPLERIRQLMLSGVDRTVADRRGCLAVNTVTELAGADPDLSALARQSFTRLEAALVEVVEDGRARGDIRVDRPARLLARQVMSAFHGLLVQAKAAYDVQSLHETIEAVVADLRA